VKYHIESLSVPDHLDPKKGSSEKEEKGMLPGGGNTRREGVGSSDKIKKGLLPGIGRQEQRQIREGEDALHRKKESKKKTKKHTSIFHMSVKCYFTA